MLPRDPEFDSLSQVCDQNDPSDTYPASSIEVQEGENIFTMEQKLTEAQQAQFAKLLDEEANEKTLPHWEAQMSKLREVNNQPGPL